MQETIRNSAFTSITEPNGVVTSSSDRALDISPNNAGRFTHTRFAVVPEGNFKLGYDFNEYVRFTVGYTFIYVSGAAAIRSIATSTSSLSARPAYTNRLNRFPKSAPATSGCKDSTLACVSAFESRPNCKHYRFKRRVIWVHLGCGVSSRR